MINFRFLVQPRFAVSKNLIRQSKSRREIFKIDFSSSFIRIEGLKKIIEYFV